MLTIFEGETHAVMACRNCDKGITNYGLRIPKFVLAKIIKHKKGRKWYRAYECPDCGYTVVALNIPITKSELANNTFEVFNQGLS